jgi:acetate kinase
MKKAILTMNAGSSSLKFGMFCKSTDENLLLKSLLQNSNYAK